jgi:hypothetical protein
VTLSPSRFPFGVATHSSLPLVHAGPLWEHRRLPHPLLLPDHRHSPVSPRPPRRCPSPSHGGLSLVARWMQRSVARLELKMASLLPHRRATMHAQPCTRACSRAELVAPHRRALEPARLHTEHLRPGREPILTRTVTGQHGWHMPGHWASFGPCAKHLN